MKIDKMKLASGDRGEFLKLARTIRPSKPLSKTANPVASQFFPDDGAEIRHLSADELAESLAGAEFNERGRTIDMASQGLPPLPAPKATGDVSQIGGARSGWTPGQRVSIATGAKAATTGRLERALLNNRLAKAATPNPADSAILTATLKSIIHELLGTSLEHFDANTLKVRIAKAIKARPDVAKRLVTALGASETDINDLIAMGAKVTKTGSGLSISV
jgi:hypothetical protein